MADLVEQTSIAARTIREYIRLELLPAPVGSGPAARYTREHLLRLWVIAEGRRQGVLLADLKLELAKMSPRDMARHKPKKTAEKAAPGPSPAVAAPPVAPPEPEPASTPHPRLETAPSREGRLSRDPGLPGRQYTLVPLLPGLVLMVDGDAPSIVRRTALEIVERYGAANG